MTGIDTSIAGGTNDGDSIKVFVRVRPPVDNKAEIDRSMCLEADIETQTIRMQCRPEPKVFRFDQVADIYTTQETIFNSVGRNTIENCIAGYNGTIFAYGQTGSGKTYTMLGPADNSENFKHDMRGVIPRSFEYLFNIIKNEQELNGDRKQFLCKCSFLEIYNEQVFDLLDPASTGLQLREDLKRGVFADGLIEESVSDASQAYQCLTRGWLNRTVASTSMNRESSRSHAVFTVHLESKETEEGVCQVRVSRLHLVDLAGSERQKDTNTGGLRLKEAGSINKSLSILGNVIMALVDITHGKTRHVPYRDSKLTFLLRDSLGGNSKTHIIACVHPGSKHYGETLSTLQFARRAKMIKNKAVVNEDTQGSVVHLQAEIRKLKELLAQYQQGIIPMEPSGGKSEIDTVCVTGDAESHWRQCFLEAMFFRQQTLDAKKERDEKYCRLKEICNRKDMALRQSRMILKFREDALKRVEKAQKEKTELSNDDKLQIIESLRGEIGTLEEQVRNHPEVTQCKLLIEDHRMELERLRKSSARQMDKQMANELEKVYKVLILEKAEKENVSYSVVEKRSSIGTPMGGNDTNNVAVATIERHKTQISKMQEEINTLKRELAVEKEQSQKVVVEKESELVSLRKTKDELEKTLKAHYVRSKVERETMGELHMETLKTMTTPKKKGYHLRNRTVLVPASGKPGETQMIEMQVDESFSEDDIISDETPPAELSDEKVEALTEEIQKLQEENRYMQAQLEEQEANIISQVEETSRLECQKQLIDDLYAKEKASWTTLQEELTSKVTDLTSSLKAAEEHRDVLHGEVLDMRIMYDSLAKGIKEEKAEYLKQKTRGEKALGSMETKKMQFELQLAQVQRELEVVQEQQTLLRESEENLQATLNFTQEKLSQAEQSLIEANKANLELQDKLQTLEKSYEQEKDKSHQLTNQFAEKGDTLEKKLLEALSEVEETRNELTFAHDMAAAKDDKLRIMEREITSLKDTIERQQTDSTEKQELITSLHSTIMEQREGMQALQENIKQLTREVDELMQSNKELEQDNKRQEMLLEQQQQSHQTEKQALDDKIQKKKAACELLQLDLESIQKDNADLVSDMDRLTTEKSECLDKLANLHEEVLSKNNEIMRLNSVIAELKQSLVSASQEQQQILEKDSEIQHLQSRRDEMQRRVEELQGAFDTISKQQQDQVEANKQLQNKLTERLALLSALNEENQGLTQEVSTYKQLLNDAVENFKDEESMWRQSLEAHEKRSQVAEAEKTSAEQAKLKAEELASIAENKYQYLQSQHESITTKVDEQNTEINRLREMLEDKQSEIDRLNVDSEQIRVLVTELGGEKDSLKKECTTWEERYEQECQKVTHLAGHQNHKQKIRYLEQINSEKKEAEMKYNNLLAENARLKKKLELSSNTPVKRSGITPRKPGNENSMLTPIKVELLTPGKNTTYDNVTVLTENGKENIPQD